MLQDYGGCDDIMLDWQVTTCSHNDYIDHKMGGMTITIHTRLVNRIPFHVRPSNLPIMINGLICLFQDTIQNPYS